MRSLWLILRRLPGWLGWAVSRPFVWTWHIVRGLAGSFRFWLLLIVLLIVMLVVYEAMADRYAPLTTDAYVQAFVVQMAPQVSGRVIRVHVHEGERVRTGQLLFELDARPFEHRIAYLEARRIEALQKVKQWQAELASGRAEERRLRAEMELARTIHEQEEKIFRREATTERRYIEARDRFRASQAALDRAGQASQQVEEGLAARVGTEHALVAQVVAQMAEARLNLEYTRVHAPCDGILTNLQLRDGAYVHTGEAALAVIDTSRWVIVAHFRERCLERMQPGMSALIALQGRPGALLPARVASTGWGVGEGQGKPSGVLPLVKRQTSWVQPSQRFQVRLTLDAPEEVPLRVGMTGSVSVYLEDEGFLAGITRDVHQVLAWLYYL